MIYPKFIKKGDSFGVTAPSDGKTDVLDLKRLNNAHKKLHELGYNLIETSNTRKSINGRSSSPEERVMQLKELYKNKEISLIISVGGGEFMYEILPFLDFDIIKNNPKWFQGNSDNTILTYSITTILDIATIYGDNISSYGMDNYDKSLIDNLNILSGKTLEQNSFCKYQSDFQTYITGLESYNLDSIVKWKNLFNEKQINIQGRLIGGNIDVLKDIIGTKYDKTIPFVEKYKKDGIIWYLENYGLKNEEIEKTLWQFRESGWFKYTKGIIFGRTLANISHYNISYEQALKSALKDLNIPVIIEADFGHKAPRMTMINGAYAIISSKNGKGYIKYILK